MAVSHINNQAEKMNYNLSDLNKKEMIFSIPPLAPRVSVVTVYVDQILIRNAFKLIRKMILQMWLKFWLMAKIAMDAMEKTLNKLQL